MSTQATKQIGDSLDLQRLDPAERGALKRIRTLSRLLDESFRVPGTSYRFGLDPIIGIIPLLGDTAVSLFDAFWKANVWNADLLESHLERRAASHRQ